MTSFAKVARFARVYKRALFMPIIPVAWFVMSVFGVIAEPFGTEQLSLAGRIVFWPVILAISILIGTAIRVIVREYLRWRRYAIEAPVVAALATLVLPPICLALAQMLAATGHFEPRWSDVAAYVFIMSMAISTLRHALAASWVGQPLPLRAEAEPDRPTAPPALALPALPRLLSRIDPDLRAPIIRLQMNNHYVDVVTETGVESLLMRFADAMAETEGAEGLQVHRSHWVAREAICGLYRGRGKVVLRMRDGAVVPVSRSHLGTVLALGLPELTQPLDALCEARDTPETAP